jgi:endonuclease III
MKEGTAYAKRIKQVHAKLMRGTPEPALPEADEPLRRLVLAALTASTNEDRANQAFERLLEAMVDLNEVRVSRPVEIAEAIGDLVPDPQACGLQISRLLQAVFDRENRLSLERLGTLPRREAKQYLEQLDGADEYVVASVMLWSLTAHAIPVDDGMLKKLQKADLVHPEATRSEVQAFLERHISAAEARAFCVLMRSFEPPKSKRGGKRGQAKSKAASGSAKRSTKKTKRSTGKRTTSSKRGGASKKRTNAKSAKTGASKRTASS